MKFLILFFISCNLFSLEIDEIRFHLSNIAINLESPTITSLEKENARNRLMQIYQEFMQELSGWDEDHLGIMEDMLNHISPLLLDPTLVYTRTTLDQLIDTLEGYLMGRDNQTPVPPVTLDLLRRAHQEILTQRLPEHMARLARLINGEDGTAELRALYRNLQENYNGERTYYEAELLRVRLALQAIIENDYPAPENRDIRVQPAQNNRERITMIRTNVEQLIRDQALFQRYPTLQPIIQQTIRMLVRAMHRLTDTERNELINLIQTGLHPDFWERQRDIQWYRAPQITAAQYAQVASNVRMMR
ncbi:MAG: hypothetical protein WCK42_03245 [Myxococcaceae bacterium]